MNRLTKRILACVCVCATLFACACSCDGCSCSCGENGNSVSSSESSQESVERTESDSASSSVEPSETEKETLDESSFEGTYTAITAVEAATFFEGLKNAAEIGSPKWWNDYFEDNGGGQIIMEISSSKTKGYILKDTDGFLGSVTTTAEGGMPITSYYLADGMTYRKVTDTENNTETKVKFEMGDTQTNGFWQGLALYDFSGHIDSIDPYTGKWSPRKLNEDWNFAYYIDATDSEYTKMHVITSYEGYKDEAIFICQNDYIVACHRVRTNLSTGEAFIDKMLLPWTGTIEKPTDLDTYIGA